MKKTFSYLSILLLSIIFIVGCGSNPKKNLETAFNKMHKLNSFAMDFKANINTDDLSLPIKVTGLVNTENKVSHLEVSLSISGEKSKTDLYLDSSIENQITTYYQEQYDVEELTWKKSTFDITENNTYIDISKFTEILDNATSVETVKSEDKNSIKYQITVSAKELNKLIAEETDELKDIVGTFNMNTENNLFIDVYVEKKSGYITKIYTDLSDLIVLEDDESPKFIININFSKFNDVGEIEIPVEIIKNAVENESDEIFDTEEDFNLQDDITPKEDIISDIE